MKHPPSPLEIHQLARQLWTIATADPDADLFARVDNSYAAGEPVPDSAPRRTVNWVIALHRYEQFWRDTGSTPRENTRDRSALPAFERRMGEWARYQRRFEDTRNGFQRARLDVSPAFQWDPLEHQWSALLEATIKHVVRTGRLPYLNGQDRSEFILARWLGRQLRLRKAGLLPSDRSTRLDEVIALSR